MPHETPDSKGEIADSSPEVQKPLDKLLNIVDETASAICECALVLHPDSQASYNKKSSAFAKMQTEWTKLRALKYGLDSGAGRSLTIQMGPKHKILSEIADVRKDLGLDLKD